MTYHELSDDWGCSPVNWIRPITTQLTSIQSENSLQRCPRRRGLIRTRKLNRTHIQPLIHHLRFTLCHFVWLLNDGIYLMLVSHYSDCCLSTVTSVFVRVTSVFIDLRVSTATCVITTSKFLRVSFVFVKVTSVFVRVTSLSTMTSVFLRVTFMNDPCVSTVTSLLVQ